jgi:hypothetical protein
MTVEIRRYKKSQLSHKNAKLAFPKQLPNLGYPINKVQKTFSEAYFLFTIYLLSGHP